MKYGIGLDIGIASVGYAVIGLNENEEPCGIIRMGSRIFDKAEQPKTGASLAAPRREARSLRRRLRRHKHRILRIKNLILEQGLLSKQELENLYNQNYTEDIYELRTSALDEAVSNKQFAKILIHIAQRRGFKSNRKSEQANSKEDGKLLKAIAANILLMQQKQYRTVGEMFYKDELFKNNKRNKGENYLATVQRDMVEAEVKKIFESQRKFNSNFASTQLENAYLEILLSQRNFDEGPGGNSPYSGNQIEKMVGKCTFEPQEMRAAKACYSFEYFVLLEKINHIRIQNKNLSRALSPQEREKIILLAHTSPDITYFKIRKEIKLQDNEKFNTVNYNSDKTAEEAEKAKLNVMRAYHEIRKALDKINKGYIKTLSASQLNTIGNAFSLYKSDDKISAYLKNQNFKQQEIDALLAMSTSMFKKFGHLSVKACDNITQYLKDGLDYDKACEQAGYNFKAHNNEYKGFTLPACTEDMESITSPVVRRAVAQTIKVINAIIREQQTSPIYVNIELAREMAKNFSERMELKKQMEENASQNEQLVKEICEITKIISPTGQDITKYRLWKEQNGICAYSLRTIPIENLFTPGYAEIDHIVPYSISFDDSRNNKVLVMASENRQKGNRLPLQYMQDKQKENFIVWVNTNIKKHRKKINLLKEAITEEDKNKFKERNLQDTKHMASFLYNYISDYLLFADSSTGKKRRVFAINGIVTSHMRKRWGLTKVRADGDKHHALDAVVIACTTQKMINDISKYYNFKEIEYIQLDDNEFSANTKTGEVFPAPWPNFRNDIVIRLGDVYDGEFSVGNQLQKLQSMGKLSSYDALPQLDLSAVKPIFVSRMPCHKTTGAAHKETIKGTKLLNDGFLTVKTPLTSLKLNADGEIADYYMPSSDLLLYNALKNQLIKYNGKADEAFKEPFYKPKSDNSQGPLVKKVKLLEKSTVNVLLNKGTGVANNDAMVRIDVFFVENQGYYFVPIYIADTNKKTLPNKAVVAGKSILQWKEMDDKNFAFSLYPNDLVKLQSEKGIKFTLTNKESTLEPQKTCKEILSYFISANISTASIKVITNDNSYCVGSMGIKGLKLIEKYQVDILGNISKVSKENRRPFNK